MSTREISTRELSFAQRRAERYLRKNQRKRLLRAQWMKRIGDGAVIAAGIYAILMTVMRHVI